MCRQFIHKYQCFPKLIKQSFSLNTEEFLNLSNDGQVYSGKSAKDILAELIAGDQSDEEEMTDFS